MNDHSRWMEKMQGQIGNRSLREIVIPGTHDSGAHDFAILPSNSPDATTAVVLASKSKYAAFLAVIPIPPVAALGVGVTTTSAIALKRWAKTQNRNFKEQLEDGIRYFDLRVACDGSAEYGNMRCVHSIWAAHVSKLVDAIKEFVKTRRKEIIILDFNHFYEMSPEAFKALAEGLKQKLGTMLIPRSVCLKQVKEEYHLDLSVKLNDIWKTDGQVIIAFGDRNVGDNNSVIDLNQAPFDAFWPANTISSSDYCGIDRFANNDPGKDGGAYEKPYDKLHREQKAWLANAKIEHAERLYVFQGIISPSGSYITSNLSGSVKSSCANHVTEKHFEALLKDWRNDAGVNITIVDFYDDYKTGGKSYLDVVIELNRSQVKS